MTVIPGFATDLLAGRVGVVTGATRGIGLAIAEALAAAEAKVALADIDGDGARAAAASIGANAQGFAVDAADASACLRLAGEVRVALGPVDILVNNAGVFKRARLDDAEQVWTRVMAVNVDGPFHMARAFLAPLIETRGSVVNIASTRGFTAAQDAAAHSTSKGAVINLTRALAAEVAARASGSTRWHPATWRPIRPAAFMMLRAMLS